MFYFWGMKTRFRFRWIHLVVAALLALIGVLSSRCKDQEPLPPGIEGVWKQTAPESPGWIFTFDSGIVTQRVEKFGGALSHLVFTYAERGDTLYIGGDAANAPRTWVVTMLGVADMKVREAPADTTGREEWMVMYFERI